MKGSETASWLFLGMRVSAGLQTSMLVVAIQGHSHDSPMYKHYTVALNPKREP